MREIFNQEISKKEIDITELKSKLSAMINIPLDVKVKIETVFSKVDNTFALKIDTVLLPLPGLYRMKQVAASAA